MYYLRRAFAILVNIAFAGAVLGAVAPAAVAAESSACQREPRDAVAQMCADQNQYMYGIFVTFAYPDVSYGAPLPDWPVAFYNETEFFTDGLLRKSFAFGLDMTYLGSETHYQPYWIDYSNGFQQHPIGGWLTTSDKKQHTFMAIPSCDGCTTWDLFLDFVHVATTGTQPGAFSQHVISGWTLTGMYGPVDLSSTGNRVRFLNGNYQFVQFDRSVVSTRVAQGDCSPGSSPDYCWRFDTNLATTTGSPQYVTSWDVTKPMVRPGALSAQTRPHHDDLARLAEDDELARRAQQLVDQRYRPVR